MATSYPVPGQPALTEGASAKLRALQPSLPALGAPQEVTVQTNDYAFHAHNTPIIIESNKGNGSFDRSEEEDSPLAMDEIEKEAIKRSLKKYNGRRKEAAEELKISERTLYRKIKQYNLQ